MVTITATRSQLPPLSAAILRTGSIRRQVEKRVRAYGGEKDAWLQQWFAPTLERIDLRVISWEEILAAIEAREPAYGGALGEFYGRCLEFNGVG